MQTGVGIQNPNVNVDVIHGLFLREMSDLLLTNFPGHSPLIEFDGAGGISMGDVSRVEISGFEIGGPNRDITKEEALEDRLLHSNR